MSLDARLRRLRAMFASMRAAGTLRRAKKARKATKREMDRAAAERQKGQRSFIEMGRTADYLQKSAESAVAIASARAQRRTEEMRRRRAAKAKTEETRKRRAVKAGAKGEEAAPAGRRRRGRR